MKRTRKWYVLLAVVFTSAVILAGSLPAQVTNTTEATPGTNNAEAANELTIAEVQAKLDALAANSSLDDSVKELLRSKYAQAITALKQAEENTAKAAKYRDAVTTAPQQIKELRAELERLPPADRVATGLPRGNSDELQKELDSRRAALVLLNQRLSQVSSDLAAIKRRPEEINARLPAVKSELAVVQKQLASPELAALETSAGRVADRMALQATQSQLQSELVLLPVEQASLSVRQERLQTQTDLLTRQVENATAGVEAIQETLSQRLTKEAQQVGAFAESIPQNLPADDTAALALATEVQSLASEFETVVKDLKEVAKCQQEIGEREKFLSAEQESIQDQIELGGSGQAMAQLLFDVYDRVLGPGLDAIDSTGQVPTLDAARGGWVGVQQKIRAQSRVAEEFADRSSPAIERLVTMRLEVLEKLSGEYRHLIRDLTSLERMQQQYREQSQEFRNYLQEQLFWMRSAGPVSIATLTELPEGIRWTLQREHGMELAGALTNATRRDPGTSGAVILILAGLVFARRRMFFAIEQTGRQVRRISTDRYALTVRALLGTLLLAAPIPLLFGGLWWAAHHAVDPSDWLRGLCYGLKWSTSITLVVGAFAEMCRPGGLGAAHFRWHQESLGRWRSALRSFVVVYIPGLLVLCSCLYGSQPYADSVGRVTFMLVHVWTAIVVWHLFGYPDKILAPLDRDRANQPVSNKRNLTYALIFAAPLLLVIMAWRGYLTTACELSVGWLATAGLCLCGVTLYWMGVRWFALKKRRLALAEAIARRRERREAADSDAQGAAGEVVSIDVEDDRELDLDSISVQTRQLLRLLFGLGVGTAVLAFWSGNIPLLAVMDRVSLPGGYSLLDFAKAVLIVGITWIAARDLPGLLELSVLRSTSIETGARYAISTLCQYALIAVGALALFQVLNVDWTKFGWIAAALSVGLGFGLQEVVANFVCGLLLLFEQPVRVGDVVTVENVTGTVTRIRMRATTITNWDRQELMVPNKALITNSVLNWTLTATTNRVVISVGVAYGSNTDEATQILLDVAAAHPLILEEPAPLASFEGFADSSLTLVLRAYLPSLDNRLKTITELHAEIDKRFAEAGIEIAFPQRDLHLRSGFGAAVSQDVAGEGRDRCSE